MTTKTVRDLPEALTIAGADTLYVIQNGVDKRVSADTLKTYAKGDKGDPGDAGATGDVTPAALAAKNAAEAAAATAVAAAANLPEWMGPWLTGTAYGLNDQVSNGGSSYICILAHTSGASTEPGVGASWATNWNLVAQKGDTGAAGAAGSTGATGAQGSPGAPSPDAQYTGPHYFPFYISHYSAGGAVFSWAADGPQYLFPNADNVGYTDYRYIRSTPFSDMRFPDNVSSGTYTRIAFKLKSGPAPTIKTVTLTGGTAQGPFNFTLNSTLGEYEVFVTPNSGNTGIYVYLEWGFGTPATISPMSYSFTNPNQPARSMNKVALEAQQLSNGESNYFSKSFSVTGAGVTNTAGTLFVPANTHAEAYVNYPGIGEPGYISFTFESTRPIFKDVYVEYRNDAASAPTTQTYRLELIGKIPGGKYLWGAVHKIDDFVGVTTIDRVTLKVNNQTLAQIADSSATITNIKMQRSDRLPMPGADVSAVSVYNADEIVVKETSATSLSVYKKCSGTSDTYIEYNFNKINDLAGINASIWNQDGIYTAARTGTSAFTRNGTLATAVHTIAVNEQGKADHMGCAHGDHRDDGGGDFTKLLIDGQLKTITGSSIYQCNRFELLTSSRLIEARTTESGAFNTNARARVVTRHTIDARDKWDMVIAHRFNVLENFTAATFYLAMLKLWRYINNDSNGTVLCDRLYRWPDWTEELVASGTQSATTTRAVKLSGPGNIGVEMEALEGWTQASRGFQAQIDSSTVNCRWNFLSGVALTAGQTFDSAVGYRFTKTG